ncbi:hypothetical protein [Actinomadura mexicana]|uniref:Uncharacterized protein n=1 Tax=Actinomadura mexicana TaxID=134959 RepID=A0A239EMB9_9ACTN|nr:hypothetical protein [Actinomadura mexicana]SNS45920.1 hypothetical protein SAMN06265355_1182 [Actinomadura mexicana]
MSTRILGLLTTTAAISVALSGGVAAASVERTAPPPAPPQANAPSGTNPAFDMDPFTINSVSDPAPDPNAAANAEPKPNTAPEPNAAAPESPPRGRSEAKDGTDLKACEDAECQVEIKDGQTITFDRKLGLDPLHIKIDGSRVTFSSRGRNGVMITSIDAAWSRSNATYNNLTLRPHRAKNGAMILDISHD